MKRILSILLIMFFLGLASNANMTWAETSNAAGEKASANPFQVKNERDLLMNSLQKEGFASKRYGDPINWTLWSIPSTPAINKNAIRIQLAGKEEYLSFINIELHTDFIKSDKDFDKVLTYAQKIYNKMFPQWENDHFLHENFTSLTKDQSVSITRDNIVFEFCYFEKAKIKQVIISPRLAK